MHDTFFTSSAAFELPHVRAGTLKHLIPFLAAALLANAALFAQDAQSPAASAANSIYVSPKGDDSHPGTQAQPVRTLQRARDLVRAMNHSMSGDITVHLFGGTYRLSEPLTLDARDSGANGHDVVYTAEPGQQPVISGGVQVTGWKLVDAGKNLWSAPLPAGVKNSRQLYVNGIRAPRTRGRIAEKLTETATGYTSSSPFMAKWKNPGDIEIVYTGGNALWSEPEEALGGWTEPRCPVAGIDGNTITMAQPCWDNSTKRVMLPPESGFKRPSNLVGPASVGKHPLYVENAFELLGTPGQWYLDRAGGNIYYTPRAGEDLAKADVELPVLEQLISANGTPDKPVHDLVFTGLRFAYATWLFPSSGEGFSEIQANYLVTGAKGWATQGLCTLAPGGECPYGAWTKSSGNVVLSYARQVQFTRDAFIHLGGAGLEFGHGSQSNLVEGCIFTDISANSVELGGVDLPEATPEQIVCDNQVRNNHIFDVPVEFHGGVAICAGYTQRTVIEHNQIDHMAYTGISMGWGGWPDKIQKPGQANVSRDALVANNLIFNHLLLLADGGAIYTQGLTGPTLEEGEKLIGNVIHDQFSTGHGIYTDNGCKNVTGKRNVIFRTNFDNWGSRHRDYYSGAANGFDAFDFEDNYWQQGDPDSSKENVTLKNNHLINSLKDVPASMIESAGVQPAFKDILTAKLEKATAPEAPSRVAAASGGDGIALVSWNPPVFEGGAPIESYTVTASSGEHVTVSSADFWAAGYVQIPKLSKDADYTFTVTAQNTAGTSVPSLPSEKITLKSSGDQVPEAPGNVSANPGDGMASVHFESPAANKGSPIIAYTFTAIPGGHHVTFGGRAAVTLGGKHRTFGVIDALENGKSYTIEVRAVNAAGESAPAITKAIVPTAAEHASP